MASNDSDDDYIGHPLFPIPMDRAVSARRRFDLIQINRILPDKKTRETCPVLFNGGHGAFVPRVPAAMRLVTRVLFPSGSDLERR
jgi:hypothetical protein